MKVLDELLDVFFPPVCGFCGRIEKTWLCEECKKMIEDRVFMRRELAYNKYFDEHIYLMHYDGTIRQKILTYKFDGKGYMYKTFTKILLNSKKVCDILKSYDIIVPVPIHKLRKKQRGYNQSGLIAREIANNIKNIEYVNGLKKIKNNPRQSMQVGYKDREQNVKNAYEIINRDKIQGKKIILFDDIFTTGSTANECSRILKQNGAKYILVLSLAK